jgi:serine/threonine protein kinase
MVAIKVIPVGDDDEINDIQREIDMLRGCDHPNVVRYLVRCCTEAAFVTFA